jgi:CxxC motif-containing protein
MEIRELTCIGCPMGCSLKATIDNGTVTEVTGNTCPKGDRYARKECTNPTRIVTSTVAVRGGVIPRVSCKTGEDIPKDKIFAVMEAIEQAKTTAPVHIGDVIIEDVCHTGVAVVATKNVESA